MSKYISLFYPCSGFDFMEPINACKLISDRFIKLIYVDDFSYGKLKKSREEITGDLDYFDERFERIIKGFDYIPKKFENMGYTTISKPANINIDIIPDKWIFKFTKADKTVKLIYYLCDVFNNTIFMDYFYSADILWLCRTMGVSYWEEYIPKSNIKFIVHEYNTGKLKRINLPDNYETLDIEYANRIITDKGIVTVIEKQGKYSTIINDTIPENSIIHHKFQIIREISHKFTGIIM